MSGSSKEKRRGEFTGRHMAIILVTFFGIVMAVNFTMARYASSTFGGLVVDNSYVASQKFNGWLEKARREKALGWSADVARRPDLRLDVTLATGQGLLQGAHLTALARHPLGQMPERSMTFRDLGDGHYESREALPAGRWIVHLKADAQGRTLNLLVDLQ
jgi:nitrogen fixation protein FixH